MALVKFLLPLVVIPILLRLALRAPLRGLSRVGALVCVLGASAVLLALGWLAPTVWQLRVVLVGNAILFGGVALLGFAYWRSSRVPPSPR
jgi:hypothetical protein